MKSESQIIREVIETARRIERVQARKDYLESLPTASDSKHIEQREQAILEKDIEICSLGEKLNTFVWLFED